MRQRLAVACFLPLLAASGCQQASLAEMEKSVKVTELPAGDSAGRYQATVETVEGGTYFTYMGLLVTHAGRGCEGRSFAVDDWSDTRVVDGPVAAGETLTVAVTCNHDRLPNHRELAEGDTDTPTQPPAAGSLQKSASQLMSQYQGSSKVASEVLIGGFLREAYTEECAGKPVIVEYLATATTPGTPSKLVPDPKSMHATMHYRCMDGDATPAADVATPGSD